MVYSKRLIMQCYIPEIYRISFTRLRLSSHRLRIETGRWSRLPRENRLCPCGAVQDERHVLENCPLTQQLRDSHYKTIVFPDIINKPDNYLDFKFTHNVLRFYE